MPVVQPISCFVDQQLQIDGNRVGIRKLFVRRRFQSAAVFLEGPLEVLGLVRFMLST